MPSTAPTAAVSMPSNPITFTITSILTPTKNLKIPLLIYLAENIQGLKASILSALMFYGDVFWRNAEISTNSQNVRGVFVAFKFTVAKAQISKYDKC